MEQVTGKPRYASTCQSGAEVGLGSAQELLPSLDIRLLCLWQTLWNSQEGSHNGWLACTHERRERHHRRRGLKSQPPFCAGLSLAIVVIWSWYHHVRPATGGIPAKYLISGTPGEAPNVVQSGENLPQVRWMDNADDLGIRLGSERRKSGIILLWVTTMEKVRRRGVDKTRLTTATPRKIELAQGSRRWLCYR